MLQDDGYIVAVRNEVLLKNHGIRIMFMELKLSVNKPRQTIMDYTVMLYNCKCLREFAIQLFRIEGYSVFGHS